MKRQNWYGTEFPAIVSPITQAPSLADYLKANRADVDLRLVRSGALLFRGFEVPTVEDFDKAVLAYGAENFPYKDSLSNAVRVNLTERVFTANEAPPDVSIYLHHEMAQTPLYPSKLFLYCNIAAERGGATPLCRSDILLEKMEEARPDLVIAFAERGVKYRTIMPGDDDPNSGMGRSWRSTLTVNTREEAEARLSKLDYRWAWGEDETLSATTPRLEAVRALDDGRRVFFNQLIAAFRGWKDARNDPSKSITFGDGGPISADDMRPAIALSDELSFDLEWKAGDVALVDNFLVMHGRRPFEGTRKVLASLVA